MNTLQFLLLIPVIAFVIAILYAFCRRAFDGRWKEEKSDGGRSRRGIVCAAALLRAFVLIVLASPTAQAQVTPTTISNLTGFANMPANTTSNFIQPGITPTTNIIAVQQGTGMAFGVTVVITNAGITTNTGTLGLATTIDGTNYCTNRPDLNLSWTITNNNGATTNTIVTNYTGTQLNNLLDVTPYTLQNANGQTSNTWKSVSIVVGKGNIVPGGFGGN